MVGDSCAIDDCGAAVLSKNYGISGSVQGTKGRSIQKSHLVLRAISLQTAALEKQAPGVAQFPVSVFVNTSAGMVSDTISSPPTKAELFTIGGSQRLVHDP